MLQPEIKPEYRGIDDTTPEAATDFCFLSTTSYVASLILAARSILLHNYSNIHILIVDKPRDEKALQAFVADHLCPEGGNKLFFYSLDDILNTTELESLDHYSSFEVCCALKYFFVFHLLKQLGLRKVVYLDSDMVCFGKLDGLSRILDVHPLTLTAHDDFSHAGPVDLQRTQELLKYGAFNAGIFGVLNSISGLKFVEYMKSVCRWFCLDNTRVDYKYKVFDGCFVDQRPLDYAPVLVPNLKIIFDRGFNLGHWNVGDGDFKEIASEVYVGDARVYLIHLSGFDTKNPWLFSRWGRALNLSNNSFWTSFAPNYAKRLGEIQTMLSEDRLLSGHSRHQGSAGDLRARLVKKFVGARKQGF